MTIAPWCAPDDLTGACLDVTWPEPADPPVEGAVPIVDQAIAMSSEILFYLTGSKWGGPHQETVRPMAGGGGCGCAHDPVARANNRLRGVCPDLRQQDLGLFPVISVDEVKIDGAVVDPARYRVDDRRYLVAVRATAADDRIWWPSCQVMDLPDTQEGTWSAKVTWGYVRPAAGRTAAAALACELAIGMLPEDADGPGCRLPQSWTSITRAGVSISKAAIETLAAGGLTGLPEVDLWLVSLEKAKGRQGSAVIVPGRPRDLRRTGPPAT